MPVPPGFRFQPVDADEVAARLVELSLGKPSGFVPDIAGPRMYELMGICVTTGVSVRGQTADK